MDALCGGMARQSGHGHNVPANGHNEARAGREAHFAQAHGVALRRADQRRIRRETVLRLGNTHRQVPEAVSFPAGELVAHRAGRLDMVCPVDAPGDRLDFVEEAHVVRIERAELSRRLAQRLRHDPRKRFRAPAAFGPVRAERNLHPGLLAIGLDSGNLARRVIREPVDRHYDRQAVLLQVLDMPPEIAEPVI